MMEIICKILTTICLLYMLFGSGLMGCIISQIVLKDIRRKDYILAIINSIGIFLSGFLIAVMSLSLYFVLTNWPIVVQFMLDDFK